MSLTGVDQITSWGFYLRVGNEAELQELLDVRPEYVCRGFFDWGCPNADYPALGWIAERAHAAGILFEGGTSYSPVRPEAGTMDEATLADLSTCNPCGDQVPPADNASYLQGAIHNPRTREWFLDMARVQIDAGVDGIHIDEIECHYPWRGLGFDRYALDSFRDWLIARYGARGWRVDDPRWGSELGVDLDMFQGSMANFDFLRHLGDKGLLEDACIPRGSMTHEFRFQQEDAIGALWGNPWFERYEGTFQFDLVERYWGEAVIALKEYAGGLGRHVIVNENMNGCARPFADYTMAHGGLSYHDDKGNFNLTLSVAKRIRNVKAESLRRAGSIPLVFFLDWGHAGSDMDSIPEALRRAYVSKLAAEVAAEGAYFALPISGGGYNAVAMGYQDVCIALAAFYRQEKRLFLNAPAWDAAVAASEQLTARGYEHADYRVIHCVNHRVDGNGDLALRSDAEVSFPAESAGRVTAFTGEWSGGRQLKVNRTSDGSCRVTLPLFQVYCALEISPE